MMKSSSIRKNGKPHPLALIEALRESFYGSTIVYTQGSCSKLYEVLKCVYPRAKMRSNENHVVTEIDGVCYDIDGVVADTEDYLPVKRYSKLECRFDLTEDFWNPKKEKVFLKCRKEILRHIKYDTGKLSEELNLSEYIILRALNRQLYLGNPIITAFQKLYGINIQQETFDLYSKTFKK